MKMFSVSNSEKIIIYCTLCLLLGRAWQHLFWDAPFRTFLWEQDLMENFIIAITNFNSWNEYVTSPIADIWIDRSINFVGLIYAGTFLLLLMYQKRFIFLKWMLMVSGIALILLTICLWKEKFYQIGQLIEYSSQVICPFLAILILFKKIPMARLITPIKLAIALTFIGHGLYAVGFHPQPGHFVDMILNIFPLQESTARTLLIAAGILDFVVAILIFIPTTYRWALYYILIWAILTSFARIVSHIDFNLMSSSIHQWFFEVLVRVPHFGLPFALILLDNFIDCQGIRELESS